MPRFSLHRRSVLKGAGGVAVALPFLEVMSEGSARAAVAPRRFVIFYGGFSKTQGCGAPVVALDPTNEGFDYDLGLDLTPLGKTKRSNGVRTIEAHDVQNEVTLVSGLKIPWASSINGAAPDTGYRVGFHGATASPLLAGAPDFRAPTVDQVVAGPLGKTTQFPEGVQYQVQASSYESGSDRGLVSRKRTSSGQVVPVQFQPSPQAAFGRLFSNFTPGDTAQDQVTRDALKKINARKRSILDFVVARAERLAGRLGRADKVRVEQHLDEIRALEKQISDIAAVHPLPICSRVDPGTDPAADPALTVRTADNIKGWSGEDLRGKAMGQLLFKALACDLARSGFMLITMAQSYLNPFKLCGWDGSVHGTTHCQGASLDQERDVVAWHIEQYALFVRQLMDTYDVDGRKMIDNTVVLFVTEGGAGGDGDAPMSSAPPKSPLPHSTENMSVLVAGGRGLGLLPGRHIRDKQNTHPAAVIRAAMKAVGVDVPLGAVTADYPKLMG